MLRLVAIIICFSFTSAAVWDLAEETAEFWEKSTKTELNTALNVKKNLNKAKNVIIMIGDGMGVSTVTAGRIMKGQVQGQPGEEALLEFDKFPNAALIKTYAVDRQISDSAATATAMLSGVKANFFTVGLTAAAKLGNCSSALPPERSVDSIFVDAYKSGKSSGVVTTTRLNHATPSAAYAHCPQRRWYSDADMPEDAKTLGCKDIAQQLVDHSHKFTVMLGGGRKYFRSNSTSDAEYPDQLGVRQDGKDLIAEWREKQETAGKSAQYVWNKTRLDAIDLASTDTLLGMFEPEDMKYDADRKLEKTGDSKEPSLAEMTETAIKMLQKNENGFALLVEGGRIDHAHHATSAYDALHDTLAFDDAVAQALKMTSQTDTLLIVTADHSHVFTMGGYSERGNPILGLAPSSKNDHMIQLAEDGKTFTTLLYGNGPGFRGKTNESCQGRENLTTEITESPEYLQQTAVPLDSESHGGEDVAVYALGPMAHLFHGTHDQTYIARVMRYASCLGDETSGDHCTESDDSNSAETANSESTQNPLSIIATEFLGMSLDTSEAQVALYIQFVLLICFALFSFVVTALFWRHLKTSGYPRRSSGDESVPLNEKI
uniref:Alkaline phosphatase n=1 Tax=Phallusia mammillata TaxID=59560 RepID=A0A6F9D6U3_9ASCI|nr:CiAP endoderm-specific alkaline phosphatase precursor [Phallusia mammillata]